MLEKNTRKTLTAEPLRKLSLRISGCDAAPVVPWNRDGSHGFSPVKAHADSAGVSCRVATTATCEKRYLPNGLVSLLQSIEASVARRPLGLQLAGGSGASHRFERTDRRVSLVSLALHEVVHHRSDPAGAPWDSILGHGCGGLRTFLCKSAE